MKKIALIFRHSIRTDIESGGLLTEEGKLAAQRVGSKIDPNIPITYYATDVQRCIDTCKNIELGRTGLSDIVVHESPIINDKQILNGGYFYNGEGDPYNDDEWVSFAKYAIGDLQYPFMLDPKTASKQFLNDFLTVMPNNLSIWVTHDSQVVPLLYNLTGITKEVAVEMMNRYGWSAYPWSAPLTGIAIINDNDNISIKRIKGLKHGLISSDAYDYDHVADIID